MQIINYIRKIFRKPKLNFNKLENTLLKPAKLSGGNFSNTEYPKEFVQDGISDTCIILSGHDEYFEAIDIQSQLMFPEPISNEAYEPNDISKQLREGK